MNCSRIHVIFASVLICVSSSTPAAQSDFDGRLPVWPSQAVDPADLSAPDAVRDFIADYEGKIHVFYETEGNTPRLLSTDGEVEILPNIAAFEGTGTSSLHEALSESVRAFVDMHPEFFGTSGQHLSASFVQPLGNNWLVGLRQRVFTESGDEVFVRGANVSALVSYTGMLLSMKVFLLRDAPSPAPDFGPLDATRTQITEDMGYSILDEERQLLLYPFRESEDDRIRSQSIWCVRYSDPDSRSGEFFVDAPSGVIMEQRAFYFELGVAQEDTTVSARGVMPTIEPSDANYFFTTPLEFDLDNPQRIEGARVVFKKEGHDYTDSNGEVHVEAGAELPSVLDLEAFIGGVGQRLMDHCDTFFVERRATLRVMTGGCFVHCIGVLVSTEGTLIDGTVRFLMNDPDSYQVPEGELLNSVVTAGSGNLLSFHHIRAFLRNHLATIANLNVPGGRFFPLEVIVQNPTFGGTQGFYEPYLDRGVGRICMTAQTDEGQWLTPTFIYHEAAHHAIFDVTGALVSRPVDCFNTPFDCLEDLVEDGSYQERELQEIEGATDALAAYFTGLSQFGYSDQGQTAGPLSYDIALDPSQNGVIDATRALIGRLFWDIREEMLELRGSIEGLEDSETIKAHATALIHLWLGRNHAADGVSRRFLFGPALVREIQDTIEFLSLEAFAKRDEIVARYRDAIRDSFNSVSLAQARFLRGDGDHSGLIDITDAISTLQWLFLGVVRAQCQDALDVDDSGFVDLTDPILILRHLFLGDATPAAPFPNCGFDNLEGGTLGCPNFGKCDQ